MSIARVQKRFEVTVPKDVRDSCRIQAGSDLYFVVTGPDRFECVVLPAGRSVLEVARRYAGEGSAPELEVLRLLMGEDIAQERLPRGGSSD